MGRGRRRHWAFLEFSFLLWVSENSGFAKISIGTPTAIPRHRWDKIRARGIPRDPVRSASARWFGLNGSIFEIWQFRLM